MSSFNPRITIYDIIHDSGTFLFVRDLDELNWSDDRSYHLRFKYKERKGEDGEDMFNVNIVGHCSSDDALRFIKEKVASLGDRIVEIGLSDDNSWITRRAA